MHISHTEPHYAPSSVGALMDPGFLRQAIHDAGEQGFFDHPAPERALTRWRAAVQAVAAALHRLTGH